MDLAEDPTALQRQTEHVDKLRHKLFNIDDPIIGPSGSIIAGGMWPSQRAWWNLPNFVRLFVGGYGSGKTIQLCKRHLALSLINAPIPNAIVSPTYSMARDTVVVTMLDLLNAQQELRESMGQRFFWKERKSPPFGFTITHQYKNEVGEFVSRTGSITIYSGEDPRKLKGPNLSAAGIDEPFIQDQEVFEQMVFRVRHRASKKREVNLVGTPEQLNWGYELAEGELRDRYDVGIIQASTTENKAIAPEYLNNLLNALDPKAQQAYIHGQFVNLAKGQVYYSFDRRENVVELARPAYSELGVGMDFNVNPMAFCVFWVIRSGNYRHIHIMDEFELANSDTQEACRILKEKYWHQGLRDVYPDPHAGRSTTAPGGKTDYDYIAEAGFRVNKRPGVLMRRDRYNAANNMFRPYGDRIRMTVSPRCTKLVKYLMTYSYELMMKDNQKAMSHLLDAATYPVAYLFPSDRETLKLRPIRGL